MVVIQREKSPSPRQLSSSLFQVAQQVGDGKGIAGPHQQIKALPGVWIAGEIHLGATVQPGQHRIELGGQRLPGGLGVGCVQAVVGQHQELATRKGNLAGQILYIYAAIKDFSVSLTGDVEELKRFLATMENLRRLVEIESVQLAKEKELTLVVKGVLKSYEEK